MLRKMTGNLCGLCLLHDNLNLKLPLFFCRHVYKFLLGRKITFADFAFFDAEAYKVLFDLVKSAAEMAPEEELGFDWEFAGIGKHDRCPSDGSDLSRCESISFS